MVKEVNSEIKVGVGIDVLWKALAMDMNVIFPKIMPDLLKDANFIEGDGGVGSVYLFNFSPAIKTVPYQKEKIVELDKLQHRLALQVVEGGHLNLGFSYYKTTFQLKEAGFQETVIEFTVEYECEEEESIMPQMTIESTRHCMKCLETYLLNEVI